MIRAWSWCVVAALRPRALLRRGARHRRFSKVPSRKPQQERNRPSTAERRNDDTELQLTTAFNRRMEPGGFVPKPNEISFGRRHFVTGMGKSDRTQHGKELLGGSPQQTASLKPDDSTSSDLRYQVQAQTMTEMAKQLVASEADTKRARGLCFKTLFVCRQWQRTAHIVWRAVGQWRRDARAAAEERVRNEVVEAALSHGGMEVTNSQRASGTLLTPPIPTLPGLQARHQGEEIEHLLRELRGKEEELESANLEMARYETRLSQMEDQMEDHRDEMHRELQEARSMTPMRHEFSTPAQFDFSGGDQHPDTEALHKAGLEIQELEKELREVRGELMKRDDWTKLQEALLESEAHNLELEVPLDQDFT